MKLVVTNISCVDFKDLENYVPLPDASGKTRLVRNVHITELPESVQEWPSVVKGLRVLRAYNKSRNRQGMGTASLTVNNIAWGYDVTLRDVPYYQFLEGHPYTAVFDDEFPRRAVARQAKKSDEYEYEEY